MAQNLCNITVPVESREKVRAIAARIQESTGLPIPMARVWVAGIEYLDRMTSGASPRKLKAEAFRMLGRPQANVESAP